MNQQLRHVDNFNADERENYLKSSVDALRREREQLLERVRQADALLRDGVVLIQQSGESVTYCYAVRGYFQRWKP